MDSNLLKEAIADAKAVRATALANAKAAMEEAFEPRFQAMFADKLKEEANFGTEEFAEESSVSESEIDSLIKELEDEVGGDENMPSPDQDPQMGGMGGMDDEMDDEMPEESPAPAVGAPIPAGVPVIIQPVDQAGAGAGMGAPVPPAPVDDLGGMGGEEGGFEDDDEVDLNELLESLKAEAECDDDDDRLDESVPVSSSAIGGKVGGASNKQPSSDASATSHLESAGKDRVGGGEGYKGGVADPTTAKRPNSTGKFEKTPTLAKEEIENGVPGGSVTAKEPTEAKRPNQADHATKTDLSTPSLNELQTENKRLKNQLGEATEAVAYIKGQLNEINLLNAKLLFTNKLFKEVNMPNERKMRVIEMFDLARNVREVKLTYATIAESINFSGDMSRKPRASSTRSITEGIASKAVGSTKPASTLIVESAMVSKFQKLAGIKKK
jgi:hypothetical protein